MQLRIIDEHVETISWRGKDLVDWATGIKIDGEGEWPAQQISYAYNFDAAITSADGQYALVFTKQGTKGLLLKNGKILREINRSYYQAEVYEYPAAFFVAPNGRTYLAHCPVAYCQLDFEDVETGEVVTRVEGREPQDYFYSRLEVSADNKWLISKGWVWHPWDMVVAFNIGACLQNPALLDNVKKSPDVNAEVGVAGFISNHEVLIGAIGDGELMDDEAENVEALQPGQLVVWNLETDELSAPVMVKGFFGNIFPIDDTYTWDLAGCARIINYRTGEVVDQLEEFLVNPQVSSIIHHIEAPKIAYNRETKAMAVITKDRKVGLLTR
ncbi:hypothetical protein HHL17_19975 [Chitinophaga sp. G-6-1-13]|uniref:Uncharacterized protein n=1 Tax=Chitinophaga fulva TaxID=2728842 RepID=A0A848GS81_9BACT|nr:hypothetical protein [Chitinophaga fulva]NML39490.1 hypothetical protein [Chitinophaga fulva]